MKTRLPCVLRTRVFVLLTQIISCLNSALIFSPALHFMFNPAMFTNDFPSERSYFYESSQRELAGAKVVGPELVISYTLKTFVCLLYATECFTAALFICRRLKACLPGIWIIFIKTPLFTGLLNYYSIKCKFRKRKNFLKEQVLSSI